MKKFLTTLLCIVMIMAMMPMVTGVAFAGEDPVPVTTNIMTASGTDTGLRLTGDHEATSGTDYTVEIDEFENNTVDINIKTSDWKITGVVDDAFNGKKVRVFAIAATADMHLTIGDIDQNGSKVTISVMGKEGSGDYNLSADIDISKPLTLSSIGVYSEKNDNVALTLNKDYLVTVDSLNLSGSSDVSISGPGTVNVNCLLQVVSSPGSATLDNVTVNSHITSFTDMLETYCAALFVGDVSVENNSKLFAVNELTKEQLDSDSSTGVQILMGSLAVDETSECFISGLDTAVEAHSTGFISTDTGWKCSADVVTYENKAQVTANAEEAFDGEETYQVKVKGSDSIAKTLYKAGTTLIDKAYITLTDFNISDPTAENASCPNGADYEVDTYTFYFI